MLEIILGKHVVYVAMGVLTVAGIVSKLIVAVTQKRMVKAAGNMGKSSHPFMRLVKAKFEHACMVSDKVENVDVFVDKFLYEYRTFGIRLHSFRRMEKIASLLCLLLGVAAAVMEYSLHGMSEEVLRFGAFGAGLAILIYLVHLTTDESFRMEAAKNYMVDYLQNVCLHRYEKMNQKELKVMAQETNQPEHETAEVRQPVREEYLAEAEEPEEEILDPETPVVMAEAIEPVVVSSRSRRQNRKTKKEQRAELRAEQKTEQKAEQKSEQKPEDPVDTEVAKDRMIRQILEEFMA